MGSLVQRPKLAPRDGQEFGIQPLLSVGAKGAEKGGKGRQIRRPFHSDAHLFRSLFNRLEYIDNYDMILSLGKCKARKVNNAVASLGWVSGVSPN
jgi:hypothetical protein